MYSFPVTSTIVSANVCLRAAVQATRRDVRAWEACHTWGVLLSESSHSWRAGSAHDKHAHTEMVPPEPPGKPGGGPPILQTFKDSMALCEQKC